jgi:hypothetical protein
MWHRITNYTLPTWEGILSEFYNTPSCDNVIDAIRMMVQVVNEIQEK